MMFLMNIMKYVTIVNRYLMIDNRLWLYILTIFKTRLKKKYYKFLSCSLPWIFFILWPQTFYSLNEFLCSLLSFLSGVRSASSLWSCVFSEISLLLTPNILMLSCFFCAFDKGGVNTLFMSHTYNCVFHP